MSANASPGGTTAATTGTRTLTFLGPGDPDHLDPDSGYHLRPGQVLRVLSRQLFAVPVVADVAERDQVFVPVPDVAEAVPTQDNGGLSADLLTCVVRLRPGVLWDTEPPREVTAHDFVRGLARMTDPGHAGDVARFFTDTVRDVRAADDRTLVFHLHHPANDLVNLLSTGYATALPEPHEGERSAGPYRVAHRTDDAVVLERNPVWRPETDPVRRAEADRIVVRRHGPRADPAWPFGIVTWNGAATDEHCPGYTLNPYLVLNLRAGGALSDLRVRQAIGYAVDKVAVRDIFAALPGVTAVPAHSMVPPGALGYSKYNPYPTPGDRGDPEKSRALLAEAGFPNGLRLAMLVRDSPLHRSVFDACDAALARAGIALEPKYLSTPAFYAELMSDETGHWELAAPGWTPDWHGNNNRSVMVQLLRGAGNYGGYENPRLDALIGRALGAVSLPRAALLWHQANIMAMTDLPVIPVVAFACRCCAARTGATGRWP
ncbi:ABC transporter substrate-binding protein [Goodfellowiella coeruleoviolacea]|uniref:Peptide/nickel transport system substrate-binding protein n=1 Tax=Goodfellowiella coeruleoviolacea TaxID=334858 RepID=A0AAE3KHS6_9PSEU|nr:ABC transporter substrate-binding protein [Goodfellowiella coeruleoviolacea]MCP2167705.1 peptide/nickel transport system substrate-binding protein [Goodfellowiella coeruleoviolacea]